LEGKGLAGLSLSGIIGVVMDYVSLLAVLLFAYIVGSSTRQLTTLFLMLVVATLLIPSIEVVPQVVLLHLVFHQLSKLLRWKL